MVEFVTLHWCVLFGYHLFLGCSIWVDYATYFFWMTQWTPRTPTLKEVCGNFFDREEALLMARGEMDPRSRQPKRLEPLTIAERRFINRLLEDKRSELTEYRFQVSLQETPFKGWGCTKLILLMLGHDQYGASIHVFPLIDVLLARQQVYHRTLPRFVLVCARAFTGR